MRRLTSGLAAGLVLSLTLAACGGDDNGGGDAFDKSASSSGDKGSVTIGSASFSESRVLAEMYALVLQKAGYKTSIKTANNRELYEPALEKGDIDIVPEYAATMAEFLNLKANGPSAKQVASADATETVAALNKLGEPLGIKALEAAKAVDQNAFIVSQDYADANSLTTLSDLGNTGKTVRLAAGEECEDRPFCRPGLEKIYKIKISKLVPLGVDTPQTKQAVKSGKVELGLALTTDGTLGDLGLVVLQDDKKLQLADNLVPVVNTKSAGDPEIADALNKLAQTLTTEDLAALNKKIDSERQKPDQVAKDYLTEKGLA